MIDPAAQERFEWSDGEGTFKLEVVFDGEGGLGMIVGRDELGRNLRIYAERSQHLGDARVIIDRIANAFTHYVDADKNVVWQPPTAWAWMQACKTIDRLRAERDAMLGEMKEAMKRSDGL